MLELLEADPYGGWPISAFDSICVRRTPERLAEKPEDVCVLNMGLEVLGGVLKATPEYRDLLRSLIRRSRRTSAQILSEAAPFALAMLWRDLKAPMLVVTPRQVEARRMADQIATWSGCPDRVLLFPESEVLPYERISADVRTTRERLLALIALTNSQAAPPVIIAPAGAVAQKTLGKDLFDASCHTLRTGDSVNVDDLLKQWQTMGYEFEPTVIEPGFMSRRGGILDIYPLGEELPSRIELWGNEVDSIRRFDPETQRSAVPADRVDVYPARETLPALTDREELDRLLAVVDAVHCTAQTRDRIQEELALLTSGHSLDEVDFYAGFFNRGTILDYFPPQGLLVVHRPVEVVEASWDIDERSHGLRTSKEQRGELPYGFPSPSLQWSEVEPLLDSASVRLDVTPWGVSELLPNKVHSLPFTSTAGYYGGLERFADEADRLAKSGCRVIAATSLPNRLEEILDEYSIGADLVNELVEVPAPGKVSVVRTRAGDIGSGLILSNAEGDLVVFSDADIFGVAKQRRARRSNSAKGLELFAEELRPGDYVVHVEHGVGRFVGTGSAPGDNSQTEYMILQYAAADRLYVPMGQLDRVSPYLAPADRTPSLTRLGSQEWRKAKARAETSTRELAAELLSLYATRELVDGYSYGGDRSWMAELEDSFPFEETLDQKQAIVRVKEDMEQPKPMDRLVCGDVGYGKTEVALRAAFKAVMDGKQVALLVPTTVLAQQHYSTFSQRLSAYPVEIEVLSRFRTKKEQREVVEGLASGRVDICIGTHRLVQSDVRFKDLGLVIVDEEQRFGVAHKERLKHMRTMVDVLTLTATPIPRTLHMSLAGVRDLSAIETPPEERLPIKTYVSEFSDLLIREAILRELDREGQVFFLHNRVHSIENMATYIRGLIPEADVGVGHGQMPETQLEQTMSRFASGEMDVLVCTTIIESGLDIPNVNTLIIDRADTFGLAQLYQLRGRVGRGARRAYAYLLVPPHRSLTETAEKRLKTMLAATDLGAGFRIAMKDLEIRGAGNILGSAQSGHIHAVGFDLYTRLLSGAVEDLRAKREMDRSNGSGNGKADGLPASLKPEVDSRTPALSDVGIELAIPAHIPADYVADLPTRLGLYRRIAGLKSAAEVDVVADELKDRFGAIPWQVENVLYLSKLRILCVAAGVQHVRREEKIVVIQLGNEVGGARRPLERALGPHVRVGNTQLRIAGSESQEADGVDLVLETVTKLSEFRTAVLAGV